MLLCMIGTLAEFSKAISVEHFTTTDDVHCIDRLPTSRKDKVPDYFCTNPNVLSRASQVQRARACPQQTEELPHHGDDTASCSFGAQERRAGLFLPPYYGGAFPDRLHVLHDKHTLLFVMPKVMSSTFRHLPYMTLNPRNPPSQHKMVRTIRNYFWAAMMRDPMSRLQSAYKDLLHNPMIRMSFYNKRDYKCTNSALCTFDEMVAALYRQWKARGQWDLSMNDHFLPQTLMLGIPEFQYDFVGLINSKGDVDFLFQAVVGLHPSKKRAHEEGNLGVLVKATILGTCCDKGVKECCPPGDVPLLLSPCVNPGTNLTRQRVEEMYAPDYAFIRSMVRISQIRSVSPGNHARNMQERNRSCSQLVAKARGGASWLDDVNS